MSQFMDWVLDVAASHPDLEGAFVDADGEWLDVLLADGRAFRFRPSQMIDESKPEETRRSLLNKLLKIGVQQADSAVAEGEGGAGASTPARESSDPGDTGDANASGDSVELADAEPQDQSARPSLSSVFDAIMGALTSQNPLTAGLGAGPESKEDSLVVGDDEEEHDGQIRRLPIVRPADYFLPSHDRERDDSMVYIPLTEFIGVGLAEDHPDTIQPLFFSDLAERAIAPELGPLFVDAVEELRQLNFSEGQAGIELGIADVAGARVFWLTSPNNYQSSWFADLDMAQTISDSLVQEYPDSLPLFIPASRTSFFAVMADDPRLPKLMEKLRGHENDDDALYPLPHTVASDGWKEWIPISDHPASKVLEELRTTYRKRMYDCQTKEIAAWEGMQMELKPYSVHRLRSGRWVSNCQYSTQDQSASLPQTDFITFVRKGSGLPWDEDEGETVTIRFHVARDVWPEGFSKAEGVWPPRWDVTGFPTPDQLEELQEAANRNF